MHDGNRPRGRIDKREMIVEAAFRVFAREGYAQASVDVIAAEAGVAKPTIYAHLGGKEQMFREVIRSTAARGIAKSSAVLTELPADPPDLREALIAVAWGLVGCFQDERSAALRRLLNAEIVRFPDLFDLIRADAVDPFNEALAGRLARFAHAGRLTLDDPVRAASQFVALITEELPMLSAFGTRPIPREKLEEIVVSGVDLFLRAMR
ncbi:TetR/AcrR family transcriptional regulator [Nonomuraea sp. NPDC050663]|uniref:AcrR family transcriptional regulator n=1 Tax=Nonomuraea soli TaxID=1032476 RepID=A0A7W0CRY2_9ACTN|nr:TetR/AcrR family transcriptional regulator [Nonomuraea soli]MBA2896233.1 AcrR family transcriptional regulator [Nonomuraea soli]